MVLVEGVLLASRGPTPAGQCRDLCRSTILLLTTIGNYRGSQWPVPAMVEFPPFKCVASLKWYADRSMVIGMRDASNALGSEGRLDPAQVTWAN